MVAASAGPTAGAARVMSGGQRTPSKRTPGSPKSPVKQPKVQTPGSPSNSCGDKTPVKAAPKKAKNKDHQPKYGKCNVECTFMCGRCSHHPDVVDSSQLMHWARGRLADDSVTAFSCWYCERNFLNAYAALEKRGPFLKSLKSTKSKLDKFHKETQEFIAQKKAGVLNVRVPSDRRTSITKVDEVQVRLKLPEENFWPLKRYNIRYGNPLSKKNVKRGHKPSKTNGFEGVIVPPKKKGPWKIERSYGSTTGKQQTLLEADSDQESEVADKMYDKILDQEEHKCDCTAESEDSDDETSEEVPEEPPKKRRRGAGAKAPAAAEPKTEPVVHAAPAVPVPAAAASSKRKARAAPKRAAPATAAPATPAPATAAAAASEPDAVTAAPAEAASTKISGGRGTKRGAPSRDLCKFAEVASSVCDFRPLVLEGWRRRRHILNGCLQPSSNAIDLAFSQD